MIMYDIFNQLCYLEANIGGFLRLPM